MINLSEEKNGILGRDLRHTTERLQLRVSEFCPKWRAIGPEGLADGRKPWMPKGASDAEDRHGLLTRQVAPQKRSSDCPIAA